MLFSEADGRKVVSTATAETVGRVHEFLVDPRSRSVVALRLKKTPVSGDVLRWPDILAFGADAVTVAGVERITEADEAVQALTGKEHHVLGKRVLTTLGDEIGKVTDVDFDPQSAAIVSLVLDTGPVEGPRLIGIGSYAVVVHADPVPPSGPHGVAGVAARPGATAPPTTASPTTATPTGVPSAPPPSGAPLPPPTGAPVSPPAGAPGRAVE